MWVPLREGVVTHEMFLCRLNRHAACIFSAFHMWIDAFFLVWYLLINVSNIEIEYKSKIWQNIVSNAKFVNLEIVTYCIHIFF